MAGDRNAFTKMCSVIESFQEVVWYNQTTLCMHMRSLVVVTYVSALSLCVCFVAAK